MGDRSPGSVDAAFLLSQTGFLRALARELVRDPQAADDLVQDTLTTALEHPPRGEITPAGWRAWLATVLRHRAERKSRESSARRRREREVAREEATHPSHGRAEDHARLQKHLADAIQGLEEPYRTVVMLRWLDGRSLREIAASLGVTYEATRQRLSRATAMLRARLDREYGDRSRWVVFAIPMESPTLPTAPGWFGGALSLFWSGKSILAASVVVVMIALGLSTSIHSERAQVSHRLPDPAPLGASGTRTFLATGLETESARTALSRSDSGADGHVRNTERLAGVVLGEHGAPVPGAEVRVLRAASAGFVDLSTAIEPSPKRAEEIVDRLHTDADGRFSLSLPLGRTFALEVNSSSYAPEYVPNRIAGETLVVNLKRCARVRGTVTRETDGSPVVGARVRAYQQEQEEARRFFQRTVFEVETDLFGRFDAGDLPAIDVVLQCLPGVERIPHARFLSIRAGSTNTIDFVVGFSANVRGRVTDALTGRPLANAEVAAGWRFTCPVRTDAQGDYMIPSFFGSEYADVTARADGYGNTTVAVPALSGVEDAHVDIALLPARILTGRVLSQNGAPIEGAYVSTVASQGLPPDELQQIDWHTTYSDAEGRYRIANVRRDLLQLLVVRKDDFGAVLCEIPPAPEGLVESALQDVTLAPGRIVCGEIVDGIGRAVPNQLVRLHGSHLSALEWWGFDQDFTLSLARDTSSRALAYLYVDSCEARTDDRGRFAFADVAAGQYELSTRGDGAARPVHIPFSVAPDVDPPRIRIELDPGLVIEGRLVDPDGNPVAEAIVLLFGADEEAENEVSSDASGRFRLTGLQAGAYRIQAVPFSGPRAKTLFAPLDLGFVRAGERDLVGTVQPGRRVSCRVRQGTEAVAVATHVVVSSCTLSDARFRFSVGASGVCELVVPLGEALRVTAELDTRSPARASAPALIGPDTHAIELVLPQR